MKVVRYGTRRCGIGSNPSGGINIKVIPETPEEWELIKIYRTTTMDEKAFTVYERLTKYPGDGRIPMDGGSNPAWDALEKYIGEKFNMDLLDWAEIAHQEYEKERKLLNLEQVEQTVLDLKKGKYGRFLTWMRTTKDGNEVFLSTLDGNLILATDKFTLSKELVILFHIKSNQEARESFETMKWMKDINKKKITKEEFFQRLNEDMEMVRGPLVNN